MYFHTYFAYKSYEKKMLINTHEILLTKEGVKKIKLALIMTISGLSEEESILYVKQLTKLDISNNYRYNNDL